MGFGCSVGFSPQQQVAMAGLDFLVFKGSEQNGFLVFQDLDILSLLI
jgi:hypothetical protein